MNKKDNQNLKSYTKFVNESLIDDELNEGIFNLAKNVAKRGMGKLGRSATQAGKNVADSAKNVAKRGVEKAKDIANKGEEFVDKTKKGFQEEVEKDKQRDNMKNRAKNINKIKSERSLARQENQAKLEKLQQNLQDTDAKYKYMAKKTNALLNKKRTLKKEISNIEKALQD